jgi:chemotaxis protein MotB
MSEASAAPAPAPAPKRAPIHRGSFARWHLDPTPSREEEGWFITYLDVMTLLLVTMVVVLAFVEPTQKAAEAAPTAQAEAAAQAPASAASAPEATAASATPDPFAGLPLDTLGKNIAIVVNDRQVSFRISSEILFASGEADLTPDGQAVVSQLLPVLQQAGTHKIIVEGHTDNLPIQTVRFPSNWELAAGRAGSVVRHLHSRGIAAARMKAIGYADTAPLADNDTPAGRAANRRVEIILEAPAPSR